MPTQKRATSSVSAGGRSTTPASRRKTESGSVRVWSEASVTVAITQDPPQFAKFTHGFERMAPNSSPAVLKRIEREIFEECERIVDARVRKLARIIRRLGG